MKSYIRQNIQLYLVLIFWLIVGIYGGKIGLLVIMPITMVLMLRKEMYEELLIGYFFILLLSDSLDYRLAFAKDLKSVYISILSLFFFLKNKDLTYGNKLFKIFIPFLIFSLITMTFSINDAYFFTSIQKTLSYILTALILPNIFLKLYDQDGAEFLKRFIFFLASIVFIGLVLKYVMPNFALLQGVRFRGLFGNPNGLGVFSVLFFIVFWIVDDFYPGLFSRNERWFILAIILLSLIWCGSRNALLSVVIFYLFQRFFGFSPFLGFVLFLLFIFVAELISANATLIITSLGLGDFFRVQTLEQGSGRYIAWQFAWKQIQHNFFIGKGFAYNEFYMRQHYGMLLKLNHQGGIHNSFLTFWFDQGLVGLIIYLRSFLLIFIVASKKTAFAFPAMFAMAFSAFFESWLVGSLSVFAFMGIFIFTIFTSDEIKPLNERTLSDSTT